MHINTLFVYTTWTNHKSSKHKCNYSSITPSCLTNQKLAADSTHFFTYSPLVLRKWPFGALGDLWTVLAIQDIFWGGATAVRCFFSWVETDLEVSPTYCRRSHLLEIFCFRFFSLKQIRVQNSLIYVLGVGWTGTKLLARFIISVNQSLGKLTTDIADVVIFISWHPGPGHVCT